MDVSTEDIRRVASEHSTLTAYDYFPSTEVPRGYSAAPFEERRKSLFTDDFLGKVKICQAFIQKKAVKTKALNESRHPYNFKHDVEAWGRIQGNNAYIPEGAFIVATFLEGFKGEHKDISPTRAEMPTIRFCINIEIPEHVKIRDGAR